MNTITVKDKQFQLFLSGNQINAAIHRLADTINSDYRGKRPVFLVVLNGSFMFAAELLKNIEEECEVSFVKLASYQGTRSSQTVKQLIGLNESIEGQDVIVLEDIIDTGITMENLLEQLRALHPKSIRIATMLFKPDAFIKNFKIDYIGLEIPNDFIVGFGLDYDGFGRNLPDIYKLKNS